MPKNIEIIDTMIGLPSHDRREIYKFLAADLRDEESGTFTMPAQYMFKDIPAEIDADADPVAVTLYNMDRFGVARAMINVGNPTRDDPARAARTFPDRFLPCLDIDPRNGVEEIRRIRRYHDEFGLVALTTFPAGCRTSINAAPYYPIYATCVELDIPIFVNVGVPGPRIPLEPQKVEHLDEVRVVAEVAAEFLPLRGRPPRHRHGAAVEVDAGLAHPPRDRAAHLVLAGV